MLNLLNRKHVIRVLAFVTILTMATWFLPTKESCSNAATTYPKNPRITKSGDVTWDCVEFGNVYQSPKRDDIGNYQNDLIKSPIKWRVLCVKGEEALLLSEKNNFISKHCYYNGTFTWETSFIRKKLNTSFLNTAFSPDEQNAIHEKMIQNKDNPKYKTKGGNTTIDKIFCLSIEEISNPAYGFPIDCEIASETRRSVATDYVRTHWPSINSHCSDYWLRSPGYTSKYAAVVNEDGTVQLSGIHGDNAYITTRPALWLDLSSNLWSYAGTVSAKMGTAEKPKRPILKKVYSKKKGTLTVTWKRDTKATGYQIAIATNKKFKKNKKTATIIIKPKSQIVVAAKTFKKLKSKKTYYAKVRAYKKSGSKKVYGAYSKVKRVKVK